MDLGNREARHRAAFREFQIWRIQRFEIISIFIVYLFESKLRHPADGIEYFIVATDKAHLNIQHVDFAHVACSSTRLSPESWGNFKHTLKSTDHNLFVKLRT